MKPESVSTTIPSLSLDIACVLFCILWSIYKIRSHLIKPHKPALEDALGGEKSKKNHQSGPTISRRKYGNNIGSLQGNAGLTAIGGTLLQQALVKFKANNIRQPLPVSSAS
jgi:hypothetical protein